MPLSQQTSLIEQGVGFFAEVYSSLAHLSETERKTQIRSDMMAIGEALLAEDQLDIPIEHTLNGGLYTRRMLAPADSFIVSYVHKKPGLVVLESGTIDVLTENGACRLTGPLMLWSGAYSQRALKATTDVVWTTVNSVTSANVEDVEDELFTLVYPEDVDRADYLNALDELGYSVEEMEAVENYTADHINVELSGVVFADSMIHGTGAFTTTSRAFMESIGPGNVDGKRTQLGRLVNHSASPNCDFIHTSANCVTLFTIRPVSVGEELTVDYRAARVETIEGWKE